MAKVVVPRTPIKGQAFTGPAEWRAAVESASETAPPGSPGVGDRYVVASPATGAWTGHEDDIATWDGGSWDFETPIAGWVVWVKDVSELYVFDGTSWNQESFGPHAANHKGDGSDPIDSATVTVDGLMSSADKTKLNGIETGAEVNDVTSVHGRVGAVVAVQDDYAHSQASGIGANDHHAQLHKASHVSGGGDSFAAADLLEAIVARLKESGGPTTLLVGAIADGQELVRSGSGIIGKVRFGDELAETEVAGPASTTSITPVDFATLNVGSVPAGTYLILWSLEAATSAAKVVGEHDVQVQIAGGGYVTEADGVQEPPSVGEFCTHAGLIVATIGSPGTLDVKVRYWRFFGAGASTSSIRRARIAVFRVG